jgi:hypothetical protein
MTCTAGAGKNSCCHQSLTRLCETYIVPLRYRPWNTNAREITSTDVKILNQWTERSLYCIWAAGAGAQYGEAGCRPDVVSECSGPRMIKWNHKGASVLSLCRETVTVQYREQRRQKSPPRQECFAVRAGPWLKLDAVPGRKRGEMLRTLGTFETDWMQ